MSKKRNLLTASALALAMGAFSTGSVAAPTGEAIAATCNGCHGTDGHSKGAAASLAGSPSSQLQKAMMDFKSGKRPATIMNRLATGYTDEEIVAVSDYYANVK